MSSQSLGRGVRRWLSFVAFMPFMAIAASLSCSTTPQVSQLDQQAQLAQLAGAASAAPPAAPPPPGGGEAPVALAAETALPVARIDGAPISAAELAAHQSATGLSATEAREDLIDLTLVRRAAVAQKIVIPSGPLAPDVRAAGELELATKLGLAVPPATDSLIVDHAWVKDATQPAKRAAERKVIDGLRTAVVAGASIPVAFKEASGKVDVKIDVRDWHIGDHEEYPYDVVPAEAHDLPAGAVSPVIAGDGGLHLFRIYEHKHVPPDPNAVRARLHDQLRDGRVIELLDYPSSPGPSPSPAPSSP